MAQALAWIYTQQHQFALIDIQWRWLAFLGLLS
jgi:hypothetical protein